MLLGPVTLKSNEDDILDEVIELTRPLVSQVRKYYNMEPLKAVRVRRDQFTEGIGERAKGAHCEASRSDDSFYLFDARPSLIHTALCDTTFDSVTNALYLTRKTGVYYDVHLHVMAVDPNQVAMRWAPFDTPDPGKGVGIRLDILLAGFDLLPVIGVLINLPNEAPDLILRGTHDVVEAYRELVRRCPDRRMVLICSSLTVTQEPTKIWYHDHIGNPTVLWGQGECRLGQRPFFSLTNSEQESLNQLRSQYIQNSAGMDLDDLRELIRLSTNYLVAWVVHGADYETAKRDLFTSIGLPLPDNLEPFAYHMIKRPQEFFIQLRDQTPRESPRTVDRSQPTNPQRNRHNNNNRGRGRGRGSHARSQDRFA